VQTAPDGFYLTVRAESLRARGSERAAAGEVLLLAHVANPEVRNEYQRLELRHGARVRVMTTLIVMKTTAILVCCRSLSISIGRVTTRRV